MTFTDTARSMDRARFRMEGYDHIGERIKIAGDLIDRFNEVVASLLTLGGFAHVRYVNLRGTLRTGPGYKRLWANELHPTPQGFSLVAKKFADAIGAP